MVKARVGCLKRTASKHVYYLGCKRSPAQVGCMGLVLGPGVLGWPRGIGWRGRWEGGSGWGIHVYTWLIHFNVWQNPLQYCKVISLQLITTTKKEIIVLVSHFCFAFAVSLLFCFFVTFHINTKTQIQIIFVCEYWTLEKKKKAILFGGYWNQWGGMFYYLHLEICKDSSESEGNAGGS